MSFTTGISCALKVFPELFQQVPFPVYVDFNLRITSPAFSFCVIFPPVFVNFTPLDLLNDLLVYQHFIYAVTLPHFCVLFFVPHFLSPLYTTSVSLLTISFNNCSSDTVLIYELVYAIEAVVVIESIRTHESKTLSIFFIFEGFFLKQKVHKNKS